MTKTEKDFELMGESELDVFPLSKNLIKMASILSGHSPEEASIMIELLQIAFRTEYPMVPVPPPLESAVMMSELMLTLGDFYDHELVAQSRESGLTPLRVIIGGLKDGKPSTGTADVVAVPKDSGDNSSAGEKRTFVIPGSSVVR